MKKYVAAISAALLAASLVLVPKPKARAQGAGDPITFSGQATGVRATVFGPLGGTTVLSDTGPLPSSGGAREASLLTASVPGLLTAEVLHASTVGRGAWSRSEASLASLALTVGGNSIAADFLMARAMANCGSAGPAVHGSSQLANLSVDGQAISVSGAPNQTVTLPNGKVVINEQVSPNAGDITVNALHVVVNGIADVVISSAHADVTCTGQPVCTGADDFVTGGGWITGTPSRDKANFGVAGGFKNGAFWGHLTYIDHGNGMRVKGTGVTGYTIVSPNTRTINGTAEINGQGGFTYSVTVVDNGEPGKSDQFTIMLSNGYSAGGPQGGGNIEIHDPCHEDEFGS